MSATLSVRTWSDDDADWFRNQVAPLRENFWNRFEYTMNSTPLGWSIMLLCMVGVFSGFFFSQEYPVVGWVGLGSFVFLYGSYRLAEARKAKPAEWVTAPLAELLARRAYDEILPLLREPIEKERTQDHMVEFVVEYLFDRKECEVRRMPQTFILWAYPIFGHQTRKVVLLLEDGKPYKEFEGVKEVGP